MVTDGRAELRSVVRALVERESPEEAVRTTMDSVLGYDPELWSSLAELGLPGLGVPERFGGRGAGWAEQGAVFAELGRSLVCAPYLATVGLAVPTLLASGDEDAAGRWLPEVAAGRLIATAALNGPFRRTAADVPVRARRRDGGWRLHGVEPHVLDGAVAELLLVLAVTGPAADGAGAPVEQDPAGRDTGGRDTAGRDTGGRGPAGRDTAGRDTAELDDGSATEGGVGLFAVSDWAAGVTATAPRTSDRTRRLARIELDGAEATLVGAPGQGLRTAALARPAAVAALACEQVGGADRVLELAVEHARTVRRFGVPLGSLPEVKNRCADMLVVCESARSAAWAALRSLDGLEVRADLLATIAGAVCAEAYASCASDGVQLLGDTAEHVVQLHLRRSRSGSVLFGTPRQHRALAAELIPDLTDDLVPA
ncbi:MAG: acyl-CoA dehydrogenase family protein [Pseudonocardia sp.]